MKSDIFFSTLEKPLTEILGYWIDTKNGPRGTSKESGRYNDINPSNRPLSKFENNLAHGCVVGLQIEGN